MGIGQDPTPYLVSRFYRAPEVILGLEYGRGVDFVECGGDFWRSCLRGMCCFPDGVITINYGGLWRRWGRFVIR